MPPLKPQCPAIRQRALSAASAVLWGESQPTSEVSHLATRPDLFDRFFDDDKDFKHLSYFVISVADDIEVPGKMRQVAYVRSGSKVLNIVQGSDQVDVLLPAWLTDEKAAKKARAQQG